MDVNESLWKIKYVLRLKSFSKNLAYIVLTDLRMHVLENWICALSQFKLLVFINFKSSQRVWPGCCSCWFFNQVLFLSLYLIIILYSKKILQWTLIIIVIIIRYLIQLLLIDKHFILLLSISIINKILNIHLFRLYILIALRLVVMEVILTLR